MATQPHWREHEELLTAHLLGEASPAESAQVESWLAADPACRLEYERLQAALGQWRASLAAAPPAPVLDPARRAALLAAAASPAATDGAPRRGFWLRLAPRHLLQVAAALAVAALCLWGLTWLRQRPALSYAGSPGPQAPAELAATAAPADGPVLAAAAKGEAASAGEAAALPQPLAAPAAPAARPASPPPVPAAAPALAAAAEFAPPAPTAAPTEPPAKARELSARDEAQPEAASRRTRVQADSLARNEAAKDLRSKADEFRDADAVSPAAAGGDKAAAPALAPAREQQQFAAAPAAKSARAVATRGDLGTALKYERKSTTAGGESLRRQRLEPVIWTRVSWAELARDLGRRLQAAGYTLRLPEVLPSRRVSLSLRDASLQDYAEWVARLGGLRLEVQGRELQLHPSAAVPAWGLDRPGEQEWQTPAATLFLAWRPAGARTLALREP